MNSKSHLEAAHYYAMLGYPVAPLEVGGTTANGKLLADNADIASRATWDKPWIAKWWKEEPLANIGIAAGRKGNIIAVCAENDAALDEHDYSSALHIRTPEGGHMLIYKQPGWTPIAYGYWGGLQVISDGGYIVAPPSLTARGEYQLLAGDWAALPPVPDWLLKLEETRAAEKAAADAEEGADR